MKSFNFIVTLLIFSELSDFRTSALHQYSRPPFENGATETLKKYESEESDDFDDESTMVGSDEVSKAVIEYATEGMEKFEDEIETLTATAESWSPNAKKGAVYLMKKQITVATHAISWAQKKKRHDCVNYNDPNDIIEDCYPMIENCRGLKSTLKTFIDVADEVHEIIDNLKNEIKSAASDCGYNYSNESTKSCVKRIGNDYKDILRRTYEANLKVLREELHIFFEDIEERFLVCIIRARAKVLDMSRTTANKIRMCVDPIKTPIKSKKQFFTSEPSLLANYLNEVFDREDFD